MSNGDASPLSTQPIPEKMKKAVSQRCSYGCVVCGHPIYEFHSIAPYTSVQGHVETNLTLLCDLHVKETSEGKLHVDQVKQANNSPFKLNSGNSFPFNVTLTGAEFNLEIGSNILCGGAMHADGGSAFIPVSIDDNDLFWFGVDSQGRMFVNMKLLDENNLPVLVIENNVLLYKTAPWVIEFNQKILSVKDAENDLYLDVEFSSSEGIRIVKGRLLCNGLEVLIRDRHIYIVNSAQKISGINRSGGLIGLQLGKNERQYQSLLSLPSDTLKRYGVDRTLHLEKESEIEAV